MNLQNLVEWGELNNLDVLSGVQVVAPLSSDTLKSHIMTRCGLLIPLYSEPGTMQAAIAHWFDYMAYGISKMLELAQIEYDPLENYHRHENEILWKHGEDARTIRDSGNSKDSRTLRDTGTISDSRTVTDTGTITDDLDSTDVKNVSAYNESDYSPDGQEIIDTLNERTLDTERKDDNTRTLNTTKKDEYTKQDTNIREDGGSNHVDEKNSREIWGNIGTMTTQQMFNEELDLLARFNPYDWIVDRLEADLFLGIW